MKIQRTLVNMLVNIAPQDYQDFVLHEGKHKVIYVEMKKALYEIFWILGHVFVGLCS